jgi:hypothetical protein
MRFINSWPAKILLVFVLWIVASAWGRGKLREIYRAHFPEKPRERLFLASIGFVIAFVVVRILTHMIHNGIGPFHDVSMKGRHIHHLVWGIVILLVVGYGWLIQVGTGVGESSTLAARTLSTLYGVGAALTLDEFALWLNLRDVYWEREGRASIDAVMLFGGLLSAGIYGGRFWHALTREAVGVFKR